MRDSFLSTRWNLSLFLLESKRFVSVFAEPRIDGQWW